MLLEELVGFNRYEIVCQYSFNLHFSHYKWIGASFHMFKAQLFIFLCKLLTYFLTFPIFKSFIGKDISLLFLFWIKGKDYKDYSLLQDLHRNKPINNNIGDAWTWPNHVSGSEINFMLKFTFYKYSVNSYKHF